MIDMTLELAETAGWSAPSAAAAGRASKIRSAPDAGAAALAG